MWARVTFFCNYSKSLGALNMKLSKLCDRLMVFPPFLFCLYGGPINPISLRKKSKEMQPHRLQRSSSRTAMLGGKCWH